MDREGPEEGSSSPNVNPYIADVRRRGTREETVAVTLSEGSSFFMPSDWIDIFSKGTRLGEEDLQKIRSMDQYIRCKEWGAAYLASREESSGRLLQKMAQKGYDRALSQKVLEELQTLGFQDDLRFAGQWIRSRMRRHPESRSYMEAGLVQRGVERAAAHEAVCREVSDEEENAMLQRCIDKMIKPGQEQDEKALRRIMRRGFSYNRIKEILFHRNQE